MEMDMDKFGEMETVKCVWNYLCDDNEKKSLEGGLFTTGIVSVVLGLWLSLSILLTKLRLDRSYRNFANFTITACIRRAVPLIIHLPLLKLVQSSYEMDPIFCRFFAFLETFLAVFEVEWLTHVCIERYVVAKYITNGWLVQKYHYTLFRCLCLLFACLYSFPPLFGIGQYGLDFSCSHCTFDMILPESWTRYLVVAIFLLRSIKPAIVMLMMLTWARILERKFICSEETQKQVKFTKSVIIVTVVNQFCWCPIALIRGGVVFSQMFYSYPMIIASGLYIKWALWIHWAAPALTALALFIDDHQIRNNMLHLKYINNTEDIDNEKDK